MQLLGETLLHVNPTLINSETCAWFKRSVVESHENWLSFQSFATVDDYMEKTLKFVNDTGVKVFPLWIYFLYPAYVIAHPDHAKRLLKSSAPKDDNMGAVYTMLRPWIGIIFFNISEYKMYFIINELQHVFAVQSVCSKRISVLYPSFSPQYGHDSSSNFSCTYFERHVSNSLALV